MIKKATRKPLLLSLVLVVLVVLGHTPYAGALGDDNEIRCRPGSVVMFVGDPSQLEKYGYLPCDGNELNIVEYPELFNSLRNVYGGDLNKNTFALPDLNGRMPLGIGHGQGLTARTEGETGGQEYITKGSQSDGGLKIYNQSDDAIYLSNMPPYFALNFMMCSTFKKFPNPEDRSLGSGSIPGVVTMYTGDAGMNEIQAMGFLPCDGRELEVAEYPALFNVIGFHYGGSDDKFNLPDMQCRFPLATGQGEGLFPHYLGQTGGFEVHLPTYPQGDLKIQSTEDDGIVLGNMPPYFTVNYLICYTY